MIKKLITIAAGAGLMLVTAAPAFAGAISIGNTGAFSNVTGRIDRIKTHTFSLSNAMYLTQSAATSFTTGSNTANNNTHDGVAGAGNVTTNETAQVEMNTVNVDVDATANMTDDDITVNWTGSNSIVTATVNNSTTVPVSISNSGTVANTFTSIVNTGGNQANYNTGNGTAVGGDVSATNVITTKLNSIFAKIKM